MTRRIPDTTPIGATETWFVRHGLPYFVPEERAAARDALKPSRTVPSASASGSPPWPRR